MTMKESTRNQIIRMWYQEASRRRIAKTLGVSRKTVDRVIDAHEQSRSGTLSLQKRQRKSVLEPFHDSIVALLARYPDITVVRMHQELNGLGFQGSYSTVRDYLQLLRPPEQKPVHRFETGPGVQAQMDYSTYEIGFTAEGKKRVHAFSYILGYSRRQYVHFVESQDFTTTIREHVRAFTYLEGLAAHCLYDNMKVVVSGHDGEQPIYNTRFLAFATYYGFQPVACQPHRPETKGKVERPFHFVETNLLNARSFISLDHLNETTTWWLANVADLRQHRTTGKTPLDLHRQELPHLLPLPERPYDTAEVLYRTVNNEGCISYRANFYSVPWQRTGQFLPVRVTENELILYGPDIIEIARHELLPHTARGQKRTNKDHLPGQDLRRKQELLRQRFEELGSESAIFFDQLLRTRRCGKDEAQRILGLLATYRRQDLRAALERANRYRAFSLSAVERILAASAEPRTALESVDEAARQHLDHLLRENPVPPRSTGDYQQLLDAQDLAPSKDPPEDNES
jgi:transposase